VTSAPGLISVQPRTQTEALGSTGPTGSLVPFSQINRGLSKDTDSPRGRHSTKHDSWLRVSSLFLVLLFEDISIGLRWGNGLFFPRLKSLKYWLSVPGCHENIFPSLCTFWQQVTVKSEACPRHLVLHSSKLFTKLSCSFKCSETLSQTWDIFWGGIWFSFDTDGRYVQRRMRGNVKKINGSRYEADI